MKKIIGMVGLFIVIVSCIAILVVNDDVHSDYNTETSDLNNNEVSGLSNTEVSGLNDNEMTKQKVNHSLNETMIVFTFDDGKKSDYSVVYPMMKSRGLRSTHYLIASHVGFGAYMTWDQIKEMSDDGFDFECHTYAHKNLNELNATEVEYQLTAVNRAFQEHGLPYPKHLSYPYSSYPANNSDIIEKYRLTGRNVNAFETNYVSSTNHDKLYSLSSYPIEYGNKTEQIDKAIAGNYTLIFCIHGVNDNPDTYDINITEFEEVLDYVEEKNVPVITMTELYEILESEGYVETSDLDYSSDNVGAADQKTTTGSKVNNTAVISNNGTTIDENTKVVKL